MSDAETKRRSYPGRVALALDRFVNTVIGGDPDCTISGSVGEWAAGGAWWALAAEKIIDAGFVLFGAPWGHCRRQAAREGKI